ncbi:hypothetical protein P8452_09869 [Trifolium repens]|nr:hypothetical protein P8452_09869 [Trifolium repens]
MVGFATIFVLLLLPSSVFALVVFSSTELGWDTAQKERTPRNLLIKRLIISTLIFTTKFEAKLNRKGIVLHFFSVSITEMNNEFNP